MIVIFIFSFLVIILITRIAQSMHLISNSSVKRLKRELLYRTI